jgi:cell division transport system ATP-binding protein
MSRQSQEHISDPNTPVLALNRLHMRYSEGPEVLHDINLHLAPGSFHFLTGPSGAGKSSLLKLIYLAQHASSGQIRLFGQDVSHCDRNRKALLRRRIGVVFQEFRLLEHLSVFENIALPLRATGVKREHYEEDVVELLSWVGLGEAINAYPRTLSGGEKQRVAIARAVVAKPELLIADEPTGNVDPKMAIRLMRLFVELNRLGSTVLIASHDLQLVRASGAPVLTLNEGRLSPPKAPKKRDRAAL